MASDIGQSTVQSENKAGVAENKTLTADNDKTYRIDVEKLDYINLFNPLHSLATFCGLSLKVKRPGTWASAASVPLCLLFMVFPWYGKAVILVLLTALCLYVTQKIYTLIGHTNKHRIVCDDLLGMLYTSFGFSIEEWYYLILVFCTYRAVDMLKPFPISSLQRVLPGSVTVVVDDIISGIYACCFLFILKEIIFKPLMITAM
ncbi:MAG: phosphatidylglycerophosphatase A [Ruminobacter sp.]|jgi:phosphatidylglycerophosphatase A|nr:phosphatidylglycerophosphatase A [Ruminobacter sp.]